MWPTSDWLRRALPLECQCRWQADRQTDTHTEACKRRTVSVCVRSSEWMRVLAVSLCLHMCLCCCFFYCCCCCLLMLLIPLLRFVCVCVRACVYVSYGCVRACLCAYGFFWENNCLVHSFTVQSCIGCGHWHNAFTFHRHEFIILILVGTNIHRCWHTRKAQNFIHSHSQFNHTTKSFIGHTHQHQHQPIVSVCLRFR